MPTSITSYKQLHLGTLQVCTIPVPICSPELTTNQIIEMVAALNNPAVPAVIYFLDSSCLTLI